MSLNDEQIEKTRMLLQTSGWRDVFLPVAQQRLREITKLILLTSGERPEPYKSLSRQEADDVLRGEAKAIEWLSVCLQNEVAVFDYNRRRDELDRQSAGPNGPAPLTPANP